MPLKMEAPAARSIDERRRVIECSLVFAREPFMPNFANFAVYVDFGKKSLGLLLLRAGETFNLGHSSNVGMKCS